MAKKQAAWVGPETVSEGNYAHGYKIPIGFVARTEEEHSHRIQLNPGVSVADLLDGNPQTFMLGDVSRITLTTRIKTIIEPK